MTQHTNNPILIRIALIMRFVISVLINIVTSGFSLFVGLQVFIQTNNSILSLIVIFLAFSVFEAFKLYLENRILKP